MDISELINENLIDLSLDVDNRLEAIEALTDLLDQEDKIISKKKFKQGIIEREKEGSTGFGEGLAIPHCKSNTVKEASIAVGKLNQGVNWDSIDGELVRFIIMLAIPKKEAHSDHIEILSKLSGNLMEKEVLEGLFQVESKDKLISLLSNDKITS